MDEAKTWQSQNSRDATPFVLASTYVPSILRRRRRSYYQLSPEHCTPHNFDALQQNNQVKKLTQPATNDLENCNPNKHRDVCKTVSQTQPRRLPLKKRQHQRLMLAAVRKSTDHNLQSSRRRLLEDLLSGKYKRKASTIHDDDNPRKHHRFFAGKRDARAKASEGKKVSSVPQKAAKHLPQKGRSELAFGLRRLLAGTSQVLNYLNERADTAHKGCL